jgi:hypothetical protein
VNCGRSAATIAVFEISVHGHPLPRCHHSTFLLQRSDHFGLVFSSKCLLETMNEKGSLLIGPVGQNQADVEIFAKCASLASALRIPVYFREQ